MEDTNIRSDTFHSGDVVFSAVSVLWIAPPPKKKIQQRVMELRLFSYLSLQIVRVLWDLPWTNNHSLATYVLITG